MITPGDEYPLHQTSRPFRDPGTDRNLYDRFFFNGYRSTAGGAGAAGGITFFAAAFGTYPGRGIVDAAFSVMVNGVQHNVRGSRAMGADRLDLRCGPVTVEIVEPLHQLRVNVDAPEAGITARLLFTSRATPFEEPHYRFAPGHRTVMDITRMTQNGTWSGTITTPAGVEVLDESDWWGCRDRSWGTRPVGTREEGNAPEGFLGAGFYWLWAPLNFEDQAVLFDVNEYPTGERWHQNAEVTGAGAARSAEVVKGTHTYEIDWKPGTRHALGFTINMVLPAGSVVYELAALNTFYMSGVGYGHPKWGHGMWVGADERGHDSFVTGEVDETNPLNQHVQILCDVARRDGSRHEARGVGILEMLLVGPHAPSGFTEMLDMHPGGRL